MGLRERVQTWRTGTRRAPLPATLRRAYRRWLIDEFTSLRLSVEIRDDDQTSADLPLFAASLA